MTKAPTEKYDGEFTFVPTELLTAKLEAGQVIFTTEDDVPIENPQKTANIQAVWPGWICWDECTESGSIKVVNHAGWFSAVISLSWTRTGLTSAPQHETDGHVCRENGSGGSISMTMDCTINFNIPSSSLKPWLSFSPKTRRLSPPLTASLTPGRMTTGSFRSSWATTRFMSALLRLTTRQRASSGTTAGRRNRAVYLCRWRVGLCYSERR